MKINAMTMAVGTKQSNKKGSGQGSSGEQIKPRIAILDLIYKARRKSTIFSFSLLPYWGLDRCFSTTENELPTTVISATGGQESTASPSASPPRILEVKVLLYSSCLGQ